MAAATHTNNSLGFDVKGNCVKSPRMKPTMPPNKVHIPNTTIPMRPVAAYSQIFHVVSVIDLMGMKLERPLFIVGSRKWLRYWLSGGASTVGGKRVTAGVRDPQPGDIDRPGAGAGTAIASLPASIFIYVS